MTTYTRYLFKPVVTGLALSLAASAVALPANAADKPYKEEISIGQYNGWGDPAMAKMAINSGRALIDHLRSARILLNDGQTAQARSALITSRDFADTLERMMPYLRVVEEMMDANDHVVQANVEALATDLLPIYSSLDELAVYAPEVAHKTRAMVRQAEKHAAAGDKKHTTEALRKAIATIAEHTVYLPVEYVDQQVRAALYAVNQPKPDLAVARAAVDRAMNSLTTVVNGVVATTQAG